MKIVDKFVLVPVERYDRLIKNNNENIPDFSQAGKGDTIEEKNNLSPNPAFTGINKTETNSENSLKNPILQDSINKRKVKDLNPSTETSNLTQIPKKTPINPISKQKKKKKILSVIRKLRPPPPGIPNKVKAIDFKWLSPF